MTPPPAVTACQREPERFDSDRGLDREQIRELAALCRACPALEGCRKYVLGNDVPGYAGGMTSGERRRAGAPYLDSAGHLRRREVAA